MIQSFKQKLGEEYKSYSLAEKLFIFAMMICTFATTSEAAITRAVANSVFLTTYTADFFPFVWLVSVPINFAIVVFYNRFLPTFGCGKMLLLSMLITGSLNAFSAFYLQSISFLPFILYLWKDIFVILLFQQIWSVIHATSNTSRAKYLYGIVFGAGGIGSVFGNAVPAFFAVTIGSEKLLLFTLPLHILLVTFYFFGLFIREKIPTRQNIAHLNKGSTDMLEGLKLIHSSKFLIFILLIVLGMQIGSTLMDYQFSIYLQKIYMNQDIRTQFLGQFYGIVNIFNIFLQFIGSYVLLHLLGLQFSHLLIPFILIINCLGCMLFPNFKMMSFSFGTIKALDYSVFGIIKEMLYIPLKVKEKFKAKAFIDVFAYRSAKACASLVIIVLQFFSFIRLELLLSWMLFLIFVTWMGAVIFLFKYYQKEVDNQHINWPESIITTSK